MMPWHSNSLRQRLTWRMVMMQALVLLAFGSIAAIPIVRLLSDEQGLDDGVIENISDAVQRNADGGLELVIDDDVTREIERFPHLWFYATDIDGNSVQMGQLPDNVHDLLDDLPRVNSANFADLGPPEAAPAIVRRHDSGAGRLWIITGGGPKIRFKLFLTVIGEPLFLGLLSMLTLVSFLVIPMIVMRQLRGVQHVAAEADTIDVNQRGIRLSSAHVPDELHSLVGAVNAALQRLDDGIERRQRFLADAAHELRTPIAILQTRIELLPDDVHRSRLLLDVARLTNLANQLLDLQRLDADMTVFEPVNLVDLAAQVTADMAPLAIAMGDDISFDAEVDTVTVAGDAAALSRAIVNLVQNAVIHGGSKTAIHVAVSRDGSLRVSDTGPGIPEEHRQSIFEPFNRVLPLDQGAGLGLSLVRDIVLRHSGRITLGDAPGGGALFEISLPLDCTGAAAPDRR